MPAGKRPSLVIFAKAPIAGHAKTRLIPVLGAHGAAALHRRMVAHTVAVAVEAAISTGPVQLHFSEAHPFFTRLTRRFPLRLKAQSGGDLGRRMTHALAAHQGPVMLMGSDCPAIGARLLRQTAAALARVDAVLLPAEDGGYGLIGVRNPTPAILELLLHDIPWGTDRVMGLTRERLRRGAYSWEEPATIWDVDDAADLERLQTLKVWGKSV